MDWRDWTYWDWGDWVVLNGIEWGAIVGIHGIVGMKTIERIEEIQRIETNPKQNDDVWMPHPAKNSNPNQNGSEQTGKPSQYSASNIFRPKSLNPQYAHGTHLFRFCGLNSPWLAVTVLCSHKPSIHKLQLIAFVRRPLAAMELPPNCPGRNPTHSSGFKNSASDRNIALRWACPRRDAKYKAMQHVWKIIAIFELAWTPPRYFKKMSRNCKNVTANCVLL